MKKILFGLLFLTLTALCGEEKDAQPADPRGFWETISEGTIAYTSAAHDSIGEAIDHVAHAKPNKSNSNLWRWASVVLSASGNRAIDELAVRCANMPEVLGLFYDPSVPLSTKQKFLALYFRLSNPQPLATLATDVQRSTQRLLNASREHHTFNPIGRGSLKGLLEFEQNVDFQAALNGLLASIAQELGMWPLAKDLLMPLVYFRLHFGQMMPGTLAFIRENLLHYGGKKLLLSMAGKDPAVTHDLLSLAAHLLADIHVLSKERANLFGKQYGKSMYLELGNKEDLEVLSSLAKIFPGYFSIKSYDGIVNNKALATNADSFLLWLRGTCAQQAAKLAHGAQESLVNIGGSYPCTFFEAGLAGVTNVTSLNGLRKKELTAKGISVPEVIEDIYLAPRGTALRTRQIEGFTHELKREVAALTSERAELKEKLRSQSPLLGKLAKLGELLY